jgi:hypothetical protein
MRKDVNVGQNCVGHAVVVRSYKVNFTGMWVEVTYCKMREDFCQQWDQAANPPPQFGVDMCWMSPLFDCVETHSWGLYRLHIMGHGICCTQQFQEARWYLLNMLPKCPFWFSTFPPVRSLELILTDEGHGAKSRLFCLSLDMHLLFNMFALPRYVFYVKCVQLGNTK